MLPFKEQETEDKTRNSAGQSPMSTSNPTTELETEATSMIPSPGYS